MGKQKYEYKTIQLHTLLYEDVLNEYAKQGWRVIHVTDVGDSIANYLLEREVEKEKS